MIYLNCEVKSGLGEDTFWTWFEREFSSSKFDTPSILNDDDIVLRYSTLGFLPIVGKQVSLCWELYPQMKDYFAIDMWTSRLANVYEAARYATYRTVATQASVRDYEQFGSVDIIPIGVNTDIFAPLNNKMSIRDRYGIPLEKKVGVWIGTQHPMKGYTDLLQYAANFPDIFWIVIWKWQPEALPMSDAVNFIQIPQQQIAELINCADFFLSTNRLSSYFMAEWEAMACNIPFVVIEKSPREFYPTAQPRDDVFARGWDRVTTKRTWTTFLSDRGVSW